MVVLPAGDQFLDPQPQPLQRGLQPREIRVPKDRPSFCSCDLEEGDQGEQGQNDEEDDIRPAADGNRDVEFQNRQPDDDRGERNERAAAAVPVCFCCQPLLGFLVALAATFILLELNAREQFRHDLAGAASRLGPLENGSCYPGKIIRIGWLWWRADVNEG